MISSIVSRLVILVFGTLYPAYASYKAVRTKNVKEYVKWMMYWIVFALFTCAETFTDVFLSFWFPFYYEIKIILVLWLLSPATKGSSILYRKFVHPMLSRREQEIDEYIAKAKEQGYTTVLHLGTKGVNYATSVIMQTAIKGGGGLVQQLRRSYSLSDLSTDSDMADVNRNSKSKMLTNIPDEDLEETDDVSMDDHRVRRSRGYSPRRSASGSGRVEMYFPEVDVDVRQHGSHSRDPSLTLSAEPLYSGHHPTRSEGLAASREPLVRTASVGGASRTARTRTTRGGAVPKRSSPAEDSEQWDGDEAASPNQEQSFYVSSPTPVSLPSIPLQRSYSQNEVLFLIQQLKEAGVAAGFSTVQNETCLNTDNDNKHQQTSLSSKERSESQGGRQESYHVPFTVQENLENTSEMSISSKDQETSQERPDPTPEKDSSSGMVLQKSENLDEGSKNNEEIIADSTGVSNTGKDDGSSDTFIDAEGDNQNIVQKEKSPEIFSDTLPAINEEFSAPEIKSSSTEEKSELLKTDSVASLKTEVPTNVVSIESSPLIVSDSVSLVTDDKPMDDRGNESLQTPNECTSCDTDVMKQLDKITADNFESLPKVEVDVAGESKDVIEEPINSTNSTHSTLVKDVSCVEVTNSLAKTESNEQQNSQNSVCVEKAEQASQSPECGSEMTCEDLQSDVQKLVSEEKIEPNPESSEFISETNIEDSPLEKKDVRSGRYHKLHAPSPPTKLSDSNVDIAADADTQISSTSPPQEEAASLSANENNDSQTAVTGRLVLQPGVVKSFSSETASSESNEKFVSTTPKNNKKKSTKKQRGSAITKLFALPSRNQLGLFASYLPFWHSPKDDAQTSGTERSDWRQTQNASASTTSGSTTTCPPVSSTHIIPSAPMSTCSLEYLPFVGTTDDLALASSMNREKSNSISNFRIRDMSHSPPLSRRQ
ncbi:hypothetical protein R5R35_013330 [Gryllus longicercus]|uniref:Uncharacterized protein n=1 Tax=Gryllus longicercus TaxID=2509291 RepID=A0AAN9V3V9_9ORTH